MPKTGMNIKKIREKKGWNQIDLAEKVGINNSVLSRIEAGKRPVEDRLLIKFAEVFNVSTDYLTGRTNTNTPIDGNATLAILKEIAEKYQIDLTDPKKRKKLEDVIKLVADYRMDGNEL